RTLCRKVEAFGSPKEALAAARAAAQPEEIVLVAGSLFLIGQIKAALA
ncbi:MAG: hypothetical protein H6Q89_1576, partial [Myxococcaceae bacterium]|nr:hypothetical protein [Myxococcaceae bacterium]